MKKITSIETLAKTIQAKLFDHISFTGSVNGGRSIAESNKSNFTGLGLELGGKEKNIFLEKCLQHSNQSVYTSIIHTH